MIQIFNNNFIYYESSNFKKCLNFYLGNLIFIDTGLLYNKSFIYEVYKLLDLKYILKDLNYKHKSRIKTFTQYCYNFNNDNKPYL
jgi:hypothetical protein